MAAAGSMVTGLGVNVPQDASGDGGSQLLSSFITRAETAGFDSLWVSESLRAPVLDPLAVLSYAAAVSSRPALGAAVLLSPFRAPVQLARDVATLDRLSEGRAIIGLGLGNGREHYARYGLSVENRAAHFESGIRVLRSLLGQDRTTSHEPWWHLHDVPRSLTPVQRPTPPLWLGARVPAALDRAARLGDGWVGAGSSSLEDFQTALGILRRCLEERGRSPETFAVSKRVYLHVFSDRDDRSAVGARLRLWFDHHYGDPALADRFVVAGSASECADHLGRLRALGVRSIILNPLVDPLAQLDRLAVDVAPQLS